MDPLLGPQGRALAGSIQIPQRIIDGDFAGWLRDAMNERRMSARMVGLRADINPSVVTKLLYGGRQPTVATAIALIGLFGSQPSHVVDGRRPLKSVTP